MTTRKIKYSEYCIICNVNTYNEIYNKDREENILYLNTDYIVYFNDSKRQKIAKCNGCYPIFQCNQIGHIGYHGCLEDDPFFYFFK